MNCTLSTLLLCVSIFLVTLMQLASEAMLSCFYVGYVWANSFRLVFVFFCESGNSFVLIAERFIGEVCGKASVESRNS